MIVFVVLGVSDARAACDVGEVQKVVEALEHASPDVRTELAAAGLAQACSAPAGLSRGAAELGAVPPDMRAMIDLKVASDEPKAWMAVCSGGLQPLADMVALAPADKREHLWSGCDLERHGWFTREQWLGADGAVVVALLGGRALADAGVPSDQVGTVVRALAGVSADPTSTTSALLLKIIGTTGEPSGAVVDLWADTDELELDDKVGFAPGGRVEPTWSKKAERRGGSCVVRIRVSAGSTLRDLEFLECDRALQDDVRAAIEASTLQARLQDGAPAAGRFRATYTVD